MEREIKRNDFGQIVSYEITSSNEEYGNVYLESDVIKFDEDSYYEQYPLELNNFELPFKPVLVAFDITQNSFPFYEFTYKTASAALSNGSFPVWEMKGLSVSNVGAGNSHAGACNRWEDQQSYYTINPIWNTRVGDYIYKDPQGLTALVFMDDNKRMAFMAAGVKRSFKLEKGTGKILDVHICAGSGGARPNAPLIYYMRGSDEGNNYRSINSNRACTEYRDECNFWTQKPIWDLEAGDYIYKYENDSFVYTGLQLPIDNFSDGHRGAQTVILGTGTDYWKAFSAGGYKISFKLEKDTGKILEQQICNGSLIPTASIVSGAGSVDARLLGPNSVYGSNVNRCDNTVNRVCYTQNGKEIHQLQIGDKIYNSSGVPIKDNNNTKFIYFSGRGNTLNVKRRFKIDKLDGRILDIDICEDSAGIPIPPNQVTSPMWNMRGGNHNATTEWDAETGGAACNRYRDFHDYWTLKEIRNLVVGDYIYKSPNDGNASNTFIPNNFNTKWFAFQAGGIKRAFKIERGTGKIIDTHNC